MGGPANGQKQAAPERRTPVDRFHDLSVLGLVSSGFLALAGSGYLDLVAILLTAAGLLLRGLMTAGWVRLDLSARVVFALTLAYIGFYPIDYHFVSRDFLAATVHLVCFLAVVRVLSASTSRDYFFVKLIAFLEMVAASLLSANFNYFAFLALFLLFGVATFSSAEIQRSAARSNAAWKGLPRCIAPRLAGISVAAAAGILIITTGLFFVLPRTARAAFRHLVPEKYHLPGFSSEVRLGQIGEIQQQSALVMRVRLEGLNQPLHLKWRGSALVDFDGLKWFNGSAGAEVLRVRDGMLQLVDNQQRWRKGPRIAYEVHLRPLASDVLFFAGVPEFVRLNARLVLRTTANTYRLGYRTGEPVRYYGYSFLEEGAYEDAPSLTQEQYESCLRLPGQDPRVMELARKVTAGARTPLERARALESWLRREYSYTLELPQERPEDPIAHFLFTRRKGHCEYFASSLAVMLRLLAIPARVVTGFQSGTYNPISGWYLVRTTDAHSWVEAWLPDRGWTTFDPTPPSQDAPKETLWSAVMLYMDAAEVFWQDWVVSYDLDRQLQLAAQVEQSGQGAGTAWLDRVTEGFSRWKARVTQWSGKHIAVALGVLAALVLLAGFVPSLWRGIQARRQRRRIERGVVALADATVLYRRMLSMLARQGYEKPAWFTPLEFARVLPASEAGGLVHEITLAYNELRFGGRRDGAQRMLALLEALEATPIARP